MGGRAVSDHVHDDQFVWGCPCDEGDMCACGHALHRHDMGHGCIECRCRRFKEPS